MRIAVSRPPLCSTPPLSQKHLGRQPALRLPPRRLSRASVAQALAPPRSRALVDDRGNTTHMLSLPFARGAFGKVSYAVDATRPQNELVAKEIDFHGNTLGGFIAVDRETRLAEAAGSRLAPKTQVNLPNNAGCALIMERMAGDLAGIMKWAARRGLEAADRRAMLRDVFKRVAAELAQMHAKGLMHLDIKAENIFLSPTGEAVMGDFGAADWFDANHPRPFTRGTPAVSSPETLLEEPVGPKAEAWALMVTWIAAALGAQNTYFARALSDLMRGWCQRHNNPPLTPATLDQARHAPDGPFHAFVNDITTWRTAHPELNDPRAPLHISPHDTHPLSRCLADLLAFDPELSTLAFKQVLRRAPETRLGMAELAQALRALQPAGTPADLRARALLAEATRDTPELQAIYRSLREAAALGREAGMFSFTSS